MDLSEYIDKQNLLSGDEILLNKFDDGGAVIVATTIKESPQQVNINQENIKAVVESILGKKVKLKFPQHKC